MRGHGVASNSLHATYDMPHATCHMRPSTLDPRPSTLDPRPSTVWLIPDPVCSSIALQGLASPSVRLPTSNRRSTVPFSINFTRLVHLLRSPCPSLFGGPRIVSLRLSSNTRPYSRAQPRRELHYSRNPISLDVPISTHSDSAHRILPNHTTTDMQSPPRDSIRTRHVQARRHHRRSEETGD